jgi:hypothetical protein
LKTSSLSLSAAAAAVLVAAIVAVSTAAQAPQQPTQTEQSPAGANAHAEHEPAPTNLQVLPKTLTGEQVHHIMHGWSESLGVHCDTCHTADPGKKEPNGRPVLKFADDSKPEKKAARLMVKMTGDINENYVSMVDEGKGKVTCGTCHRGHLKPETFVPPPEHEHPHPPAGHPGL